MIRIDNEEYFKIVYLEEPIIIDDVEVLTEDVLNYTIRKTFDDIEEIQIVDEIENMVTISTLLKEEKIINDELGTIFEIVRSGKVESKIKTFPVAEDNYNLSDGERLEAVETIVLEVTDV